MISAKSEIDYRYLDVDKRAFHSTQLDLINEIGKGGCLKSIINYEQGQTLVAGSRYHSLSKIYAIWLCRELRGIS